MTYNKMPFHITTIGNISDSLKALVMVISMLSISINDVAQNEAVLDLVAAAIVVIDTTLQYLQRISMMMMMMMVVMMMMMMVMMVMVVVMMMMIW